MLKGYLPDRDDALMLDKVLILHAEHGGGNNSTFTVRTVSSSGANTYMAIAAGIASLSGYFMGGAAEAVLDMIDSIKTKKSKYKNITDANIHDYLKEYIDIKKKQRPYDLMGFEHALPGFGHAVYTISDPRSVILKDLACSFAQKKGFLRDYEMYERIERIAVELLSSMNSSPVCSNVDYYSALIYKMLDIPKELFTPIFAMSRIVGWSAHRIEQLKYTKIIRPAYLSTYDEENQFISIENRE
jgi:citrate synthase